MKTFRCTRNLPYRESERPVWDRYPHFVRAKDETEALHEMLRRYPQDVWELNSLVEAFTVEERQ